MTSGSYIVWNAVLEEIESYRFYRAVRRRHNRGEFTSRIAVDAFTEAQGIQLNCVMELTQLDLHFMFSAQDYAASFCWSMYVPTIKNMNKTNPDNKLNIFPIRRFNAHNKVILLTKKGKILPEYDRVLIEMIENACSTFTLN